MQQSGHETRLKQNRKHEHMYNDKQAEKTSATKAVETKRKPRNCKLSSIHNSDKLWLPTCGRSHGRKTQRARYPCPNIMKGAVLIGPRPGA